MKFTSKVKMPEPLHLRWNKYTGRYDMPEDHRSAGDADLITVGQAEAYANERVMEALEEAAKICDERANKNEHAAETADDELEVSSLRSAAWQMSVCARSIRELIKTIEE